MAFIHKAPEIRKRESIYKGHGYSVKPKRIRNTWQQKLEKAKAEALSSITERESKSWL